MSLLPGSLDDKAVNLAIANSLDDELLNEKSKEELELDEAEVELDDQLKRLAAQKANQDATSKAIVAIKEEEDEDDKDDALTVVHDKEEEPGFDRMTYVNNINLLLKALIIERNKGNENAVKLKVMKREYVFKVKKIQNLIDERDKLIDKCVNAELESDGLT